MEAQNEIKQESYSLHQFFKLSKQQIRFVKKQNKQIDKNRKRKNSGQLSLFGWLIKNRPKQYSTFTRLPKSLIVNIYSYLRIFQIVKMSETCSYFSQCVRMIWNDIKFFKQLQTDKLSSQELKKVLEKGIKMYHIKQLKNIYLGKNLKFCRQKIKMRIHQNINNYTIKPIPGNLLSIFQISARSHKSNAFLLDNHLQQIIISSFNSLISLKLYSCQYIRKFTEISRCRQLLTLVISQNSYLSNEDIRTISKSCLKIEYLDLSGCCNLDQGIFQFVSNLIFLKKFYMNYYVQPFGDLQSMKSLTALKEVSIVNSCIVDIEAIQLVKELQSLQKLNINGCQLLTDFFISSVMAMGKYHHVSLCMSKTKFSADVLIEWEEFCKKNGKKF